MDEFHRRLRKLEWDRTRLWPTPGADRAGMNREGWE